MAALPIHIAPGPSRPGPDSLTGAQLLIVRRLARGLSTAETAADLGIKKNTVRVQLNFVYRTLGISHRGELILWAVAHRLGGVQ